MITLIRMLATAWLLSGLCASFASAADSAPVEDTMAPLLAAYTRAAKPGEDLNTYGELMVSVLQRVQRSYAQEVDIRILTGAAISTLESLKSESAEAHVIFKTAVNAALAALDPHSRYYDAREYREQRTSASGSFGGLGIEVDMSEGLVRVVTPMESSPAARAGLRSGDLIVRFDDQPVTGMTLSDVVSRMRGQPGTTITLVVRRPGRGDEFPVSVVREIIQSQVLRWRMEEDVLVLRLARFTGSLGALLDKAIKDATATHTPRAVILDLRSNPGGLLRQAITLADAFLSEGDIVSLRGRTAGNRRTWTADAAEQLAGLPMVVLLNGASASAAELVAAALQENGRAVVMGQRSYGKGSVQSIMPLGVDKGALRLTTALYHGPSGRTVQRTGVGPDIELVAAPAAQAQRGGRREADRTRALPGADEPMPPKARVEQSRCGPAKSTDGQALACALAFIKAGTIDNFVTALGSVGLPAR